MPKQLNKAVIRNLRQTRESEILALLGEDIGKELEYEDIDYSNFPLPFSSEDEDNKNYFH